MKTLISELTKFTIHDYLEPEKKGPNDDENLPNDANGENREEDELEDEDGQDS